jgi:hypothetical protein
MARLFRPWGSCLGRSLAVAARARAADVVIAVDLPCDLPMVAHAWVEMDGVPIDRAEVMGSVIARLSSRMSTRVGK